MKQFPSSTITSGKINEINVVLDKNVSNTYLQLCFVCKKCLADY